MSEIDGGALVGKALANEGIEKAFVLCGGHIMPIFYGMRNAGIEIIDMRHECAAVYAAIAYTRASGKPAVVVTTAGPGVGNTPMGMMEAESLGIPLLQIGGAVTMEKRDAGDLQHIDTLRVIKTCSEWAKRVTYVERVPEYVSMAIRHALSQIPGPVYLELPTNLLWQKVEEDKVYFPVNYRTDAIPFGDSALIDAAAELLANAERPAAVVDNAARFSIGEHAGAIAALSEFLKMPIGQAGPNCRGLFGDETKNPFLVMNATNRADVVLALGCRFDFRHGSGKGIPEDAKVIQVHTDSRQIGFNLRVDIGIIGGAGPVANQLLEAVKNKRQKPADDYWPGKPDKNWPASLPGAYHSEGTPIHPARCAGEVVKFLAEEGRDWNIITDGGEASVWMGIAARAIRPGQIHGTGPTGTIGTGPCLAVGAWAANRKPVLWYTGDGSFGFYPMELDTMERLGIPVVCVISNDSAWGMIRLEQRWVRPEEIKEKGQCNTELHHMRAYEKMVSMWNGHGEVVTDPEEIIPAIKRAIANGKPSIINVEVDKVSPSPFIGGYAAMTKTDK
ncbi:MAG: thiamine pyrophosphate-binding protein [Deltaproteobacteria bacterium]|nr:thiamine pyrophosphate-binding protein [Deltaproteobacteria bacterium]